MQNDLAKRALTEGPLRRSLILFALPMILSNLFQQLYNAADSVIVGRFIGKEALAAVASSGNLIFLFIGFFAGMSVGAGVVISRYFGAKKYKEMRLAVHTDIALAIVVGIFLTISGICFTPFLLKLMKTPDNIFEDAVLYFRIYFAGALSIVMYNICVGILQAVGDSKHPLVYLVISSILNVLLDLLFIGVFKWGVGAAAAATAISQTLSALLCVIQLLSTKEIYKVRIREIRFTKSMVKKILNYGLPSGVQNSVIALANVIVQSNINSFGDSAMAGCGSYAKIEGFALMPITCFSMSLTTFVSQNLGAKQYERAKKGSRFGVIFMVCLSEFIGLIIWLFAPFFISLFNDSKEVIEYGTRQARTESFFFFLLAISHCMAGICHGAGKPKVPMVIMLSCWCVFRIIFITISMYFINTIKVIYWAYPITWGLSAIIFTIYYLRIDWEHVSEKQLKS